MTTAFDRSVARFAVRVAIPLVAAAAATACILKKPPDASELKAAAIYTEHLAIIHIIRKVLLRVQSYFDYVIIKHSISLGH